MATFATGGFHGTRYCKETEFGVTPTNPVMRGLRHTSNALILSKDSFQSNELRSDAQISDLRHGNRRASGDIGIELSFAEYDDFLAAALRSVWQDNPDVPDQQFLVAGVDMTSFTIERVFNDIQQYETFTGCEVDTFSFTVQTNAMVTGTISVVGKNIGFATEPLDPDPDPSFSFSPFDGFKGELVEGGTPIAVVTSVEISIANSIEPAFVIGSDTAAALTAGRINVTGTLSAYFENMDLLRKFVDEVESSLVFTLGDGSKSSYVFTLPRIKYSGGDNPVDGEGPVTLSMPFQALFDECTGTNMRIDRIPGPAAPDCILTYDSDELHESATTPDTIETVITAEISGGETSKTINGVIGQQVPGVTWAGVPDGLTGSVVKKSNTEVEITLTGTATSALVGGTATVTFSATSFAFGFCHCPNSEVTDRVKAFTIVPA